MPSNEVFQNPIVKMVAVELRFPNLFFLEGKIGDFQVKIMRDFPESEIAMRRSVLFAFGSDKGLQELAAQSKADDGLVDKVWQFKSAAGVTLAVTSKSLSLHTEKHKSYDLGDNPFRSTIASVVRHFFEVVNIPLVVRVGLRYIDEGPVFDKTTEKFNECYDSLLPFARCPLEKAVTIDCAITLKSDDDHPDMRVIESFRTENGTDKFVLDYDAWAENVETANVMDTIDRLHSAISAEFFRTVKTPILEYMRTKPVEFRK